MAVSKQLKNCPYGFQKSHYIHQTGLINYLKTYFHYLYLYSMNCL